MCVFCIIRHIAHIVEMDIIYHPAEFGDVPLGLPPTRVVRVSINDMANTHTHKLQHVFNEYQLRHVNDNDSNELTNINEHSHVIQMHSRASGMVIKCVCECVCWDNSFKLSSFVADGHRISDVLIDFERSNWAIVRWR